VNLDMVIFYADAMKTLGSMLPSGTGVKALDELFCACSKLLQSSPAKTPLQRVAAISFQSAVAQVCLHTFFFFFLVFIH
jgi:hypothetical protein